LKEVTFVDLSDELRNLNITVKVLAAPTTGQVDEAVTMITAFLAQAVLNLDDILLFE